MMIITKNDVASDRYRQSDHSGLPTLVERGVNGILVDRRQGMVVPAHTPPKTIRRLNAAYEAAVQNPVFGILLTRARASFAFREAGFDRWKAFVKIERSTGSSK